MLPGGIGLADDLPDWTELVGLRTSKPFRSPQRRMVQGLMVCIYIYSFGENWSLTDTVYSFPLFNLITYPGGGPYLSDLVPKKRSLVLST